MKQFLIKSTILTIIVLVLGGILYFTVLQPYYIAALPWTVLFFYLVTILVHQYLLKVAVKSGSRFTSYYMAVSFLKMFFYLAVAIVYVIFDRENVKPFFANFLLLYIIYTTFEVSEFLKFVNQKK
ncbi:MAG: hypothetical protein WCI54_05420 [Bacteroidia bacterium]|jgi:phosphotransferase system  glucose/maltose/N-acetylglucosamine-specific IIC component